MVYYICLDIGGTNIRAALFKDDEIQPEKILKISTKSEGRKTEEIILDLITQIWPQNGGVKAIAVAAPGFVDPQKGIVIRAVNIPGWENFSLQKYIQEKLNVSTLIENDARLAALAEWKYGAARGHHNVIYLTISTGIGGGVIVNDQILTGTRGMATELGHITILPDGPLCTCGQYGHLEALSSGTAIAGFVLEQLAKKVKSSLDQTKKPTSIEIAEEARKGDALCLTAFKRAGTYLGIALANYIQIFNPTCIVLGGGVSLTGDLLLEPTKKAMQRTILDQEYLADLTISTATLGDNSGLIGARTLIHKNNL
jgi:glucokinase